MNKLVTGAPAISSVQAAFCHVETWVFDLDNTLYPPDSALWPQIDDRITAFLMDLYGLDGLSARALQKHYYQKYGTTLKALMEESNVDPDVFMSFVHDIDRSSLSHNIPLHEAILKLPGRKFILTNGSRKHAEDTARALGILDAFEDVFDIKAAGFVPKPDRRAYEDFFALHNVEPAKAAMFEDLVKNLEAPRAAGMRTVLIVPRSGVVDLRDDWERTQAHPAFVEYVTDDLTRFLTSAITR
jgi:putative hydrolase of the HAD superfamily